MRFDPRDSREQMTDALVREARSTWGDDRVDELRPVLEITAGAIWTIAQERLELTDVEP
jgi:hypothetical protein